MLMCLVLGISLLGGTVYFDDAFGFSSSNFGSEYSVSYNSARNKTLIDITTYSFKLT